MLKYWNGPYEYWILYTSSSNKFENAYQHLIKELRGYSSIHFVKESEFSKDLLEIITASKAEYICFHVDDMIFYRPFNIMDALNLLHDGSNRLIAFFPKLNGNINYSHPSSSAAPTPVFTTKSNFKKFNVWMPMKAKSDWNYLWDLCGTIYCKMDVLTMYAGIKKKFGENGLSSPNKFEVHGNKLINLIYPGMAMKMFAACPKKAMMSVITINKVQMDYKVPIYEQFEKTTDELLKYFVDERDLDLQQYVKQTFESVHICQLILLPKKEKLTKRRNEWIVEKEIDDEEKKENDLEIDLEDVEEWKRWLLTHSQLKRKETKQD